MIATLSQLPALHVSDPVPDQTMKN